MVPVDLLQEMKSYILDLPHPGFQRQMKVYRGIPEPKNISRHPGGECY